ncbi:glutathione ABC transporter substrate-binding protein [Virgibacillus soli]|uniref:glutathione ABC transporter substrate-binding protein n=1 Tax=Paracerasibacillus soli TaxID=480284 RepID=UPI0035F02DFD
MKNFKKLLILLVFSLLGSIILVGCAGSGDGDSGGNKGNEGNDSDSAEGSEGGDLIIANTSDIVTLDPAGQNDQPSANVQENIFEKLVKLNADMEVEPNLATEWEAVEDNVWEFKLRDDVKFHDGSDFNAEVVKANIERILDEKVGSPKGFLYTMVTEVKVVDDHTVQFVTEYPFAPLPSHLAHSGGGMVSLDVIKEDYEAMEDGKEPGTVINEKPIGTGYFKFEEWKPGQEVKIVRNDDYWGDKVKLDSVTFKVINEDQTRIADLITGNIHIADPVSPSDVDQVENTDGLSVPRQSSVSLSYIGFNMEKEPFDDPKVRQAINMAIDKSQIIDGIYDGVGIPAIGPLAPPVFGYDDSVDGLEYDPEKAKELLKEAGYEDGFKTTLWTNDSREREDAAVNVQSQLKEFGIEVDVQVLEWGAYLEKTAAGEHDMFVLGWSTVTGDADYGLYALFHSDNIGDPGNRTFTKDAELDKLLDDARKNPDPEERKALYKEIQEKLAEVAPMLYLHHSEFLLGVSDKVKGLEQLPTQTLVLQNVTLEE